MPFLSKEIHEEQLKGYVITDCAVREKTIVYFCLRKVVSDAKASMTWDHDIETRFLVVNLAEGATPWGLRYLTGYNKPRIGIALKPIHQGLLVARNLDGQVSVLGGGAKFPDEFIDPRKNPSTWKIKTINGYAYSVGGSRNVYKRVDLAPGSSSTKAFPSWTIPRTTDSTIWTPSTKRTCTPWAAWGTSGISTATAGGRWRSHNRSN